MRRAILLLSILLLVAVISARFIVDLNAGDQRTEIAESRAVELFQEDFSIGEHKQIQAYFLVPVDFTYEEVKEHVNQYSEAMKAEHGDIYALVLWYYDDEVYLHDTPVAQVIWAPHGRFLDRWSPYAEVETGDYSKHVSLIEYTTYNAEYELDEEEKLLYEAMQNYSKELTGKYLCPGASTPYEPSDDEATVFVYIAEQYQTTEERLIEIRVKATMRRRWDQESPTTG